MADRAFSFLPWNERSSKPRHSGLTEIRGPYYTPMGPRYLRDLLETMGDYIDALKFAGGSFVLFPHAALKEIIDLAHAHHVEVSTGGFIERVLVRGASHVDRYIAECAEVGFDVVEISSGFISIPIDDRLRLVEHVQRHGLKPKAEIGIQFGAGGATSAAALEAAGTREIRLLLDDARRFLAAGVPMVMIESEGVTENVREWRTDVVAAIADEIGLGQVMFEAADPAVFEWYIQTHGPEVNLFVDHSQIVQLEALRRGVWGTNALWGRVATFKE
jgi:phosphosulfolactate synthase (CoM biosynthesis protein A)